MCVVSPASLSNTGEVTQVLREGAETLLFHGNTSRGTRFRQSLTRTVFRSELGGPHGLC